MNFTNACIIGTETKQLLHVGVRNKYCLVCALALTSNKPSPPKHRCYKNFSSSSTAMEQDIIVEGFCQSEAVHGLRYKYYIGDGDSSVFARIQERVPYGLRVIKVECANHAVRCYTGHLHKLAQDKSLDSSARKILRSNIPRLTAGARGAIKYCGQNGGTVDMLRHDLRNGPYHVFGDHSKCRDYYCTGEGKENQVKCVPKLLQAGLMTHVMSLVDSLVRKADRLTPNATSNQAEQFMSIVCKFTGGKRVDFSRRGSYQRRCLGSSLAFMRGPGWHYSPLKHLTGNSPGAVLKRVLKRRVKRKSSRKLNFSNVSKKKRNKSVALPDKEYDPDAVQPDLPEEELEGLKNQHLSSLFSEVDTDEKRQQLQFETVGQHDNAKWRDARANRLTASQFGEVCRRKDETPCHSLVKNILYKKELYSRHVQFGRENEKIAVDWYESTQGVSVQQSGFFVDAVHPYLGASPDGLIGADGLLEVKCIPSIGDMNLRAAVVEKKTLCLQLQGNNLSLKRNHNNFFQIQGQLAITGRHFCDLVIFTKKDRHIERILKDSSFWNDVMLPKLTRFYLQCILPEIADSRIHRGMRARDPEYTIRAQEKSRKIKISKTDKE